MTRNLLDRPFARRGNDGLTDRERAADAAYYEATSKAFRIIARERNAASLHRKAEDVTLSPVDRAWARSYLEEHYG